MTVSNSNPSKLLHEVYHTEYRLCPGRPIPLPTGRPTVYGCPGVHGVSRGYTGHPGCTQSVPGVHRASRLYTGCPTVYGCLGCTRGVLGVHRGSWVFMDHPQMWQRVAGALTAAPENCPGGVQREDGLSPPSRPGGQETGWPVCPPAVQALGAAPTLREDRCGRGVVRPHDGSS